jgi:hypothetical protein
MLQNRRYLGIYIYKDMETPGGIPRIISDELFNEVQEKMQKNKKAPARAKAKEEYILTTKLFCGHCKAMMVGVSGTSRLGKTHFYYQCSNARKKLCNKQHVKKQEIEDMVITECRRQLTDENIATIAQEVVALAEKDANNDNMKLLRRNLKEVERKRDNIIKAVTECDIDSVRKTFYEELSKLNTAHAEAERQLTIEESQKVKLTEPGIIFFFNALQKGDADDIKYRKALIATFINAVYLYDDRITLVLNTQDKPVEMTASLLAEVEGFVFEQSLST